jgi:4-hydroxy-3-methylbut-2-enyl diphosphate reductase
MTRNDLIVLAPLRIEALAVRRGVHGARVIRTGMGAQAARAAAERAASIPAARLAIAGVCGGLDPALEPGDVVVADELRGPDGRTLEVAGAERVADALRARGLSAQVGALQTAERVVTGAAREVARAGGALAVDMESWWLAPAAGDRPLTVLRAVADTEAVDLRPSLATARGGIRALRSLSRAVSALEGLRETQAATKV